MPSTTPSRTWVCGRRPGPGRCVRSPCGMHASTPTSVETVLNYVQDQFRAFLAEESRVKRSAKFLDPRVHVILYFIAPTGHGYVRPEHMLLTGSGRLLRRPVACWRVAWMLCAV